MSPASSVLTRDTSKRGITLRRSVRAPTNSAWLSTRPLAWPKVSSGHATTFQAWLVGGDDGTGQFVHAARHRGDSIRGGRRRHCATGDETHKNHQRKRSAHVHDASFLQSSLILRSRMSAPHRSISEAR